MLKLFRRGLQTKEARRSKVMSWRIITVKRRLALSNKESRIDAPHTHPIIKERYSLAPNSPKVGFAQTI